MSASISTRAALAAFASVTLAAGVQAAVIDINASADAGAYADAPAVNDGTTETNLYWRGGGQAAIAYVRFQLPGDFGMATSASINLHPVVGANQWMGVFGVPYANDTWTEGGLTWNTKPAHTDTDGSADNIGVVIGSSPVDGSGYMTFPNGTGLGPNDPITYTTNLVNFLNGAPGSSVSFAFNSVYGSTGLGYFNSRESATPPILHLEYTPVPEPASLSLLALGGLIALRRRQEKE